MKKTPSQIFNEAFKEVFVPRYGQRTLDKDKVKARVTTVIDECFRMVEQCDDRVRTGDLFMAAQSATDLHAKAGSLMRAVDNLRRALGDMQ